MKKILIIEKEPSSRELLHSLLRNKGIEICSIEDALGALDFIKKNDIQLIFSNLNGILLLRKLLKHSLPPVVRLYNGKISKEHDFTYTLKKPPTKEAVLEILSSAIFSDHKSRKPFSENPVMQSIFAMIPRIARTNASVLVCGESGTGKEVIASMIHAHSGRKDAAFIKVNCASISSTLIESEFFGHEKGAFTGAQKQRIGRFERAHKGTLLLDEVTEIPITLQAKLLRVIQEQQIERVGGESVIELDVRFISTSNLDIQNAIDNKLFRLDLFYRLNVIPIYLPSLRDRKEDILPLARIFLEESILRNKLSKKKINKSCMEELVNYSWPGNIRELRNVIEAASIISCGDEICSSDLRLQSLKIQKKG